MNKKNVNTSNQRGSLIILSMIVIFAMSSIGLSLAQTVFTQYGSNKQRLFVENAIGAAEAGVSATKQQLDTNSGFTGWNTTNKQVLYDDATRGRADYSTEVTSNADGTKNIISTGYVYRPGDTTAYNTKRIKAVVKIETQTMSTPSVYAGPGGLSMYSTTVGPADSNHTINVLGKLSMSLYAAIGTTTSAPTVNVANIACASGGEYPVACPSNQQPLSITTSASLRGTVCATNQVSTAGIYSPGSLQPNCVAPVASMPIFDKQGFVNGMTSSQLASNASCMTGSRTWGANRTYTGNVSVGLYCTATVTGDVHITGTFSVSGGSTLRAQDGLTVAPTIVVNRQVSFGDIVIQRNNLNVGVRVISFNSSNTTCSDSPSCTTLSSTDAQNSVSVQGIRCLFCIPDASILWSYFGHTSLQGPTPFIPASRSGIASVMGGSVSIDQYAFFPGQPTWMPTPPGTVTVTGKNKIVDYQQLY